MEQSNNNEVEKSPNEITPQGEIDNNELSSEKEVKKQINKDQLDQLEKMIFISIVLLFSISMCRFLFSIETVEVLEVKANATTISSIELNKNDVVNIESDGIWAMGHFVGGCTTEGFRTGAYPEYQLHRMANYGALVVQCGNGSWQNVGNKAIITADAKGKLSFMANDTFIGDNQGWANVIIRRLKSNPLAQISSIAKKMGVVLYLLFFISIFVYLTLCKNKKDIINQSILIKENAKEAITNPVTIVVLLLVVFFIFLFFHSLSEETTKLPDKIRDIKASTPQKCLDIYMDASKKFQENYNEDAIKTLAGCMEFPGSEVTYIDFKFVLATLESIKLGVNKLNVLSHDLLQLETRLKMSLVLYAIQNVKNVKEEDGYAVATIEYLQGFNLMTKQIYLKNINGNWKITEGKFSYEQTYKTIAQIRTKEKRMSQLVKDIKDDKIRKENFTNTFYQILVN